MAENIDKALFKPHLLRRGIEIFECGVKKHVRGSTLYNRHETHLLYIYGLSRLRP
jgi:hypothetical protein